MTTSRLYSTYFQNELNHIFRANMTNSDKTRQKTMKYRCQVNLQDFAYCYELVRFCMSVCLKVTFVRAGRTSAKIKNIKEMIVDFHICHQMASLVKFYSVNLTDILNFTCLIYKEFAGFACFWNAKKYENDKIHVVSLVFSSSVVLTYIFDFKY